MYTLLGRLRKASYKGLAVLVDNSTITFGQKTVTHQYPNTNRTEVEYLGLADDQFELDLYIYGNGLIEKRRKLKAALSDGKDGKLIHPFEGEVTVAAVSFPKIVDDIAKTGCIKFTVTFQKVTPQSYPSKTKGFSLASIMSAVSDCLTAVENTFDKLTNTFSPNTIFEALQLNTIMDTFDQAMNFTYKLSDKANELSEGLLDFKRQLNVYAQAPHDMKLAFTGLWNSINFVASSNNDQLGVLKTFYTSGETPPSAGGGSWGWTPSPGYNRPWAFSIPQTTLERKEKANNTLIINNGVLANSLALSYGTLVVMDFANQDELEAARKIVEDQFQRIREYLDDAVLQALEELRRRALEYLDNLVLADVIEVNTELTSAVLLSYSLYGTVDRYDEIISLNKPYDPAFMKGTVKVLNE